AGEVLARAAVPVVAVVLADRPEQSAVGGVGAAVVEEEDPLPDAPERSAAELVGSGPALADEVGQSLTHVVDREVAVRVVGHAALAGEDRRGGGERRAVAEGAPDGAEEPLPVELGGGVGR